MPESDQLKKFYTSLMSKSIGLTANLVGYGHGQR